MMVMKRSDQLLLLFSGGGRVGGETARGLESRDSEQMNRGGGLAEISNFLDARMFGEFQ